MACGCSKNKAQPAGMGARRVEVAAKESAQRDQEARDKAAADKRQGVSQSFVLDTSDGRTLTFGSALEARAARVRAGGGRVRLA